MFPIEKGMCTIMAELNKSFRVSPIKYYTPCRAIQFEQKFNFYLLTYCFVINPTTGATVRFRVEFVVLYRA